jgi:hypothetical protein
MFLPLTANLHWPYDCPHSDDEHTLRIFRHAMLDDEPSTYPQPEPNRPGEVGILGFVDSALESSQRSPETRPPGGSRGFLFFEPRVSTKAAQAGNLVRHRSM